MLEVCVQLTLIYDTGHGRAVSVTDNLLSHHLQQAGVKSDKTPDNDDQVSQAETGTR